MVHQFNRNYSMSPHTGSGFLKQWKNSENVLCLVCRHNDTESHGHRPQTKHYVWVCRSGDQGTQVEYLEHDGPRHNIWSRWVSITCVWVCYLHNNTTTYLRLHIVLSRGTLIFTHWFSVTGTQNTWGTVWRSRMNNLYLTMLSQRCLDVTWRSKARAIKLLDIIHLG